MFQISLSFQNCLSEVLKKLLGLLPFKKAMIQIAQFGVFFIVDAPFNNL